MSIQNKLGLTANKERIFLEYAKDLEIIFDQLNKDLDKTYEDFKKKMEYLKNA
jgi:hypothetical protein